MLTLHITFMCEVEIVILRFYHWQTMEYKENTGILKLTQN